MKLQHGRRERRLGWAPTVVIAMVCASALLSGHAGAGNGQTADQVADQILAVQDDADAAATKLATLDAEAGDLAEQVAATQAEVDAASATYSQMESDLAKIALNKYTGALGQSNLPFGSGSIMDDVQTERLAQFALGTGESDLGEIGAVQRDLGRKQDKLAGLQARNDAKRSQLADTQQTLDAKIAQLTTLEAQLRDAEVKAAYEAKLAAKRKQEADAAAAREAKVAALAAAATTVAAAPARGEAAADTAAATTQPTTTQQPGADRPSPTTDAPTATNNTTAKTTTTTAAPDDPEPPATTAPPVVSSDLACPVAGPRAFGDTWGAARSGGRTHEGTDMISPYGTPLVAMDDGFARMKQTSLGGNSIGLTADDGTYYFYAHLSSFEGGSRHVSKGEVIGYVGHTGDTSVNHLHIEIHPGGGAAINPYPTIRRIC